MAIKDDQCCEGCCSDLFKEDVDNDNDNNNNDKSSSSSSSSISSSRKSTKGCCNTDSGLTDLQYKLFLSFGIITIVLSAVVFAVNIVIVRYGYYDLGVFILMDPIPNVISILIGIFCILAKKQGYLLSILILAALVFVFGVLVLVELGFNVEICNYRNEIYDDEPISKQFCDLVISHIALTVTRQLVIAAVFIVTCIVLCTRKKVPMSLQQNKDGLVSSNIQNL